MAAMTRFRSVFPATLLATLCALSACGGQQGAEPTVQTSSARRAASALAVSYTVGGLPAFAGVRANYTISSSPTGVTVSENTGGGASITLAAGTTRMLFADSAIALDLDGAAGKAYRLYRAAFNRDPDLPGLGYWIGAIDGGFGLVDAAGLFVSSAEFATLYGAKPTMQSLVQLMYQNVMHREPDQAGYDFWLGLLTPGTITPAQALVEFSESPENKGQVAELIANGIAYTPPALSNLAPPTAVAVSNVNPQTVGSRSFSSSTKLALSFAAPGAYPVDHYTITATEAVGKTSVVASAAAGATDATLTGLKAGTAYQITVTACRDLSCVHSGSAAAVSGTTSEEYWQFKGSGAAVSGLTKVVSDGNARISVMRYGSDAPEAQKDRLQLYYGPSPAPNASLLAVALSNARLGPSTPEAAYAFTSTAGVYGLKSLSTNTGQVALMATGQAIPLTAAAGGKIRLFFEANGADNKTRIMYLDSQDGYVGMDFNSGSATLCETSADYAAGGGCTPTVAIAVESDAGGNPRVPNARQFKVGFPMQDDWRWNQAVGTFMTFTLDQIGGCTTFGFNQGYAVWNGSKWVVQYETGTAPCPKMFKSMQAAAPVHLGGVRYKLYYGDPSITTGKITTNMLPFLGPKRMIYSDGASSAGATTVEFEDWEATTAARGIHFLWPNGDLMDERAEGYIDDFMVVAPTGNLDYQLFYVAITDGNVAPFSAAAVLLNP